MDEQQKKLCDKCNNELVQLEPLEGLLRYVCEHCKTTLYTPPPNPNKG